LGLGKEGVFNVIITKIGEWSVHGGGILSSADLDALDDLALLQKRLFDEAKETRRRLAKALHKARSSARRKGYELGRGEAVARLFSMFALHLKVWGNAEKNLKSSIEKVLRDALGDLPKEALLLARIEKAILAARQQPVVRMHVHPSVFSLVDSVVRQFNEQYGQTGCEVVADLRQHESECRIETEKGVFEVDYDRQIKALCDDLLRELRIDRERQRVSAS
jgi:flagellar biosynthesis/type III secretory pathway protein FliH